MTQGVLIIVHGSRDPKWGQGVRDFVSSLQSNHIELCYMECQTPSLFESVRKMVSSGAHAIQIVPFFISSGGHVDHDIPQLIESARKEFPDVTFSQKPPMGEHPLILEKMRSVIKGYLK